MLCSQARPLVGARVVDGEIEMLLRGAGEARLVRELDCTAVTTTALGRPQVSHDAHHSHRVYHSDVVLMPALGKRQPASVPAPARLELERSPEPRLESAYPKEAHTPLAYGGAVDQVAADQAAADQALSCCAPRRESPGWHRADERNPTRGPSSPDRLTTIMSADFEGSEVRRRACEREREKREKPTL